MSSNAELDIDAYNAFLSKFDEQPERACASLVIPVISKFYANSGRVDVADTFVEQISGAIWYLFTQGRLLAPASECVGGGGLSLEDADVAESIVEILESVRLQDDRLHLSFLCKALIHAFNGSNDASIPPEVAEHLPDSEIDQARKFLLLHRKLA